VRAAVQLLVFASKAPVVDCNGPSGAIRQLGRQLAFKFPRDLETVSRGCSCVPTRSRARPTRSTGRHHHPVDAQVSSACAEQPPLIRSAQPA
jgi:hypothetical protein